MSDVVQTRIRDFIVENFLFGDDSQPLPGDLSLIESDMVDSTGIRTVGFLEEGFGLTIADADIVPANSIPSIECRLHRTQEGG